MSPRQTAAASINTNEAITRAIGILMFLAIGTIHFLQIVPTVEQTPLLGVGFLGIIAASVAVAFGLLQGTGRRIWMAGGGVCLAALGGYAFTRIFSTPIDHQDVGNWSCMLGLAALFIETILLALSVYAGREQTSLVAVLTRLPRRPIARRARSQGPTAA